MPLLPSPPDTLVGHLAWSAPGASDPRAPHSTGQVGLGQAGKQARFPYWPSTRLLNLAFGALRTIRLHCPGELPFTTEHRPCHQPHTALRTLTETSENARATGELNFR